VSAVQPPGERLRRAVRWISGRREEEPGAKLARLLDEAMLRFDLTPNECEYLTEFYWSPQREAKE
jgi:hypothetical protein